MVGHFKGQCYSWDVVNEALNDNGTFRSSVFFQTLGTDFIPISFAAAEDADPSAKLYYNDFNLETVPSKADGAVRIVRLLQDANVRIDGLGFQAHLDVGRTPNQTALTALLDRFTTLGLEVAYTELDIAHTSLPANPAALQQQANDYVSVVRSCLAVAECVGIVVWEFTDKYSWIPSTFPGKGDACLFDANFTKKPAYTAVSNLLVAAATGAAGKNASVVGGKAKATPLSVLTVATAVPSKASSDGGTGAVAATPLAAETTGDHVVDTATTPALVSRGSRIVDGWSGGIRSLLIRSLCLHGVLGGAFFFVAS